METETRAGTGTGTGTGTGEKRGMFPAIGQVQHWKAPPLAAAKLAALSH